MQEPGANWGVNVGFQMRRVAELCTGDAEDEVDHTMTPGKPQMAQMRSSDIDKKKPTKTSRLDRGTRAKLGQHPRAMYDEVFSQGVPARLTELLNDLDNEGKQNAHWRIGSSRNPGLGAGTSRLRHIAMWQRRSRRRPRAGSFAARPRQHSLIPARHQHVGLAFHNSPQSFSLRVSQAPPRG